MAEAALQLQLNNVLTYSRAHSRQTALKPAPRQHVKLGRERLWQLEPGKIEEAKRTLEVIGREWDVAGKLKAFAESL